MEKGKEQELKRAVALTPGVTVPDFSLPGLDGDLIRLETLLGPKGLVVLFWSGICSHCRHYDDWLNAFAEGETRLLAVASRQKEDRAAIENQVRRRGLRFPIALDQDRRIAKAWFVDQTPCAFLIDGDGALIYRGAIDNFKAQTDPEYQAWLEPALAAWQTGKNLDKTQTAGFGCPIESVYYR